MGSSISSLVSSLAPLLEKTPPPPPPPAPPRVPTPDDPEVAARREQVRLALLRRRGRASTILTSGLGVPAAAPVSRATLGGE